MIWINEAQLIDWALVFILIVHRFFYNNIELNFKQLMQDQGHIKIHLSQKKYVYLWLQFEPFLS